MPLSCSSSIESLSNGKERDEVDLRSDDRSARCVILRGLLTLNVIFFVSWRMSREIEASPEKEGGEELRSVLNTKS